MPSRRVLVLALAGIGALLCGVLFFQRDTATSSSLRSDASPAPIAAAYMGGGWRAMFACAGLTRALQRAGLFGPEHVDQLQVLSGNSGGAWFLTQLTYSEAFYENVTGTDHTIQKLVLDWMDKQRPQLQPPSAEVVANFTTWFGPGTLGTLLFVNVFTMLDVFRAHPALTYLFCATITDNTANCEFLISALVGGLSLGAETEGSWHLVIERMLNTADPTLKEKTATTRDRHAKLLGPELRVMISNMTSSYANYGGNLAPTLSWRLNEEGQPSSMAAVPVVWRIPGTADTPSGFASEPISMREATMSATNSRQSGGFTTAPLPPAWLGADAPPVSAVAALSSAAAAFLGSANWTLSEFGLLDSSVEKAEGDGTTVDLDGTGLDDADKDAAAAAAEMCVALLQDASNGPGGEVSTKCQEVLDEQCKPLIHWKELPQYELLSKLVLCPLGIVAFCAAEDAATAVLTKFQDMAPCVQQPRADPLKFDDRRCEFPQVRMADGGFTDNSAVATAVAGMQEQAGGEVRPLRVIAVANEACSPPDCIKESMQMLFRGSKDTNPVQPAPQPLVFDYEWADVAFELAPGTKYVNVAQVSTVTLENQWYGVRAGFPIEALLLSVDSPVSTMVGISTDPAVIALMAVASEEASSPGVVGYIQAWLRSTA